MSGPLNSSTPTTSQIIGGVFNLTAPTPADKQACALQVDSGGNLLVRMISSSAAGAQVVAKSFLTGQIAAIPPTTIYAIPAGAGGMYELKYAATITTPGTSGTILGGTNGFQIIYTNANGDSVVKTSLPTTPNVSAGDLTSTQISGEDDGYAAGGTNLQFAMGFTPGSPITGAYDLAIFVVYFGA